MSNVQFPDLRGLAWEYTLSPTFSTGVQQATSGREVRAAYWSGPLWKLSLTYEFLHDDAQHVDANGYSQLQQLIGFFLARQGSFDSFLIDLAQLTRKPLDSSVNGQPIGIGDGSTTSFQLVRNVAGYLEQVQNPRHGLHHREWNRELCRGACCGSGRHSGLPMAMARALCSG